MLASWFSFWSSEHAQPSKYPETGRGESENNGQMLYNGILPSSELSCFRLMIALHQYGRWEGRSAGWDVDISLSRRLVIDGDGLFPSQDPCSLPSCIISPHPPAMHCVSWQSNTTQYNTTQCNSAMVQCNAMHCNCRHSNAMQQTHLVTQVVRAANTMIWCNTI